MGLLWRARLCGFFQFNPVPIPLLRLTDGSTFLAVGHVHHCFGFTRHRNVPNVLDEARQDGKAATSDAQGYLCSSPHDAFDLVICVVGLVDEYCEVRDPDNTYSTSTAGIGQFTFRT